MKLATNNAQMEISGGSTASSFSIAMNGKAFRVLSDTLYQNKIGSIVREISCNAYDAHIMAGKADIPFVIHLPDQFEPWFSVQDFGVGLSPEDIVNVFTVYFQSTKDNSNDAVGAFGLGAKTPFSYTDQFTVTSVKDGMRRTYSAYITESGVPSIMEMDSAPTSDINGVEIKLSVKNADFNKFKAETAQQLKFFKVKPQIKNASNFAFDSLANKFAISTNNVQIGNDHVYGSNWCYLIQGNVGYPLDTSQAMDKLTAENRDFIQTISGTPVYIYFDIGQIGVTASREGVEYNAHTLANLNAKLDTIRAEVAKVVVKEISSKKSDWDKAEYINNNHAISKLARASGYKIAGANYSGNHFVFNYHSLFQKQVTSPTGRVDTINFAWSSRWYKGRMTREKSNSTVQPGSGILAIVLRDTASRPNMRAKHYLSTFKDDGFLVEIESDESDIFTDEFIQKLKDTLGGFDKIVRLSTIELPAVASDGTKIRSAYTRPTYYLADSGNTVRNWSRQFEAIKEIDDEMVYVTIKDMNPVDNDFYNYFSKYVVLKKQMRVDVPPLIAVREGDIQKAKDNANLICLKEYVDAQIAKLDTSFALRKEWTRNTILKKFFYSTNISHFVNDKKFLSGINSKAQDSKMNRYLKFVSVPAHKDIDKINAIATVCGWEAQLPGKNAIKRTEKLIRSYGKYLDSLPLLKICHQWYCKDEIGVDHVVDYVAKMDSGA